MGRADRPYGDPAVAERGRAEHRLERREHRTVAAPVRGEGGLCGRVPGSGQIADHGGAADGVDGLLGIADQDQRLWPWNAVRTMLRCIRSVSWNSSTRTTEYRSRRRRTGGSVKPMG